MKIILKERNKYILKFSRGEKFVEKLTSFCKEEKIASAFFVGLGACNDLALSTYNISLKEYQTKNFTENLEIANITGNIAQMNGKLIIHSHGVFGKNDFSAIAGHIQEMKISGTCEIELSVFEKVMERECDKDTGLNLLKN